MWNIRQLLKALLCAQACLGQRNGAFSRRAMPGTRNVIAVSVGTESGTHNEPLMHLFYRGHRVVGAVDSDGLHQSSPKSAGYDVTARQALIVSNTDEYGVGQEAAKPGKRKLQDDFFCIFLVVYRINSEGGGFVTPTTVRMDITLTGLDGTLTTTTGPIVVPEVGPVSAELFITNRALVNGAGTGLCDGCTLAVVIGACLSGDCDNYVERVNPTVDIESVVTAQVCGDPDIGVAGDPHMVGFLGQKIDWAGEDGGWYCLISDGEGFQLNVRVTAPMPEEFPDRQLVSGVSLLLANGHSFVVELKHPYTTETDGCVSGTGSPCLADGALRILVDNEEALDLQIPAENIVLPEGVHVSAANLPAECRPFGGDLIWTAQFEQMEVAGRILGETSIPFDEWVMEPDTLAAPTWCAKYLEDGVPDLLATQSNHATLRVETPTANLRLNIGINHQELVVADDGNTVVPELEFWQIDIGLERHHFSAAVGGMLGDTCRFVFDSAGNPIGQGLDALHGPVQRYRVADAFGVEFEQLDHK